MDNTTAKKGFAWLVGYVKDALNSKADKAITDTGGYFTTGTVEGALQEIGAELAGINTLIGSGVIS